MEPFLFSPDPQHKQGSLCAVHGHGLSPVSVVILERIAKSPSACIGWENSEIFSVIAGRKAVMNLQE